MTLDILDELKIPNEYRVFQVKENEKPPVPPYATWYYDTESFSGSDAQYYTIDRNCVIDLYTTEKDFELEKRLESLIPASQFEKTEDYDYNEHIFVIRYMYKQMIERTLD